MKLKQFLTYIYTLALILLLSSLAFSKNTPSGDEQYLAFATTIPELECGMPVPVNKIKYPPIAKQNNIKEKVYAMVYVEHFKV